MRGLSQTSTRMWLARGPEMLRQRVEQVHRQFTACASGGELTHSSWESQVHQRQTDAALIDMVALSQQVTQLQQSITVIHEQLTGYMLEAVRERQRTIEGTPEAPGSRCCTRASRSFRRSFYATDQTGIIPHCLCCPGSAYPASGITYSLTDAPAHPI